MSTQINVTVDTGGLLERSRIQVAANRQAFVEGQQRAKAEEAGKEQRDERLADEGRDAQGKLALGGLPAVDRYVPEPAAQRRGGLKIAYCRVAYKAQNVISILPKKAATPTDFIIADGFNYTAVISQITGNAMSSGASLFQQFRNPDASYDITQPEAWDPPFSSSSPWLGAQSCYIGDARPIYREDPNFDWAGEYTIGTINEELMGYPVSVNRTMFLPAGNGAAVLLVRSYSYLYEQYYYRIQQTREFITIWGVTDDYHYIQSNSDVSFSYSIANTNNYERYVTKAFYVNESSVQEITVSAQVETLLDQVVPLPTSAPLDVVLDGVGQEGVATCGGDYSTFPNTVDTVQPVDVQYTTVVYTEYPSIELTGASLLRQYGIGALSASNHNSSSLYSPAIYTLLGSSDPISAAQDSATNNSYSAVEALLPRTPRRYIDVKLETTPTGDFYRFYAASARPVNTTTPVSTRRLSSTSDIRVREPALPDDYFAPWQSYLAWDWDAPGYCRSQLSSLGFDLSP